MIVIRLSVSNSTDSGIFCGNNCVFNENKSSWRGDWIRESSKIEKNNSLKNTSD